MSAREEREVTKSADFVRRGQDGVTRQSLLNRSLAMKRFAEIGILVCVITVGAYAVDDHQPQPRKFAQEHSQAIPKKDNGDVPPPSVAPEGKPRAVSREGVE